MDEETLEQLGEQFGNNWSCSCGSAFEATNAEVVSKTKNALLARYSCQICGREQIFTVPTRVTKKGREPLPIEVQSSVITEDDVLDIKEELAGVNSAQIKDLAKNKKFTRISIPKIIRR